MSRLLLKDQKSFFMEGLENIREFHKKKYGLKTSDAALVYVAGVLEEAMRTDSKRVALDKSLFSGMRKCFSEKMG